MMNPPKGDAGTEYAYMCAKCHVVFQSYNEIHYHDCSNAKGQIIETLPGSMFQTINEEHIELDQDSYVPEGTTIIANEKGHIEYGTSYEEIDHEYELQTVPEEYELISVAGIKNGTGLKRKRNYENNEHIMNKLVRDPYFKLDRNTYTFKDTLGDWSETSTKLLIKLVGENPRAHFLLQYYYERRLTYWELIHASMVEAGYSFSVLQLRMRWRELFAKYRWTLNHNDLYSDKKSFEYMKDMDDLFGVWPIEASSALISDIEQLQKESGSSKTKRLGYMSWERIAISLNKRGFNYNVDQVEARWRMLVTSYKSMLDHNIMPTVEPISAAFNERLSQLIVYIPRRRKDYEKYKGKKVKLEKFPEIGMKKLIQIYKNNIDLFLNSNIKNAVVWEEIKAALDAIGYIYPIAKIKEIFFATLKLYERILQHNSIPGAIKREGPHFKELSEIYNEYGYWPHVKRKRKTLDERQARKFRNKLRESMQIWHTEETCALLDLYPKVLEKFNGQPADDLWVQLAHNFQSLGFQKRDTPEIATHIGLLRQGYSQDNNFPFMDFMHHVMKVEEALCCSPDVSKYTGDVQICYWSHDAVRLMLKEYLKIQPLIPFSSMSKEVYSRIAKEMTKKGYKFTKEQIEEEFRTLLVQFTLRRCKPEKSSEEDWTKCKSVYFCREEMREVMKLRSRLSVGFTNGIKPIPDDIRQIILYYGLEKMNEVFSCKEDLTLEEQKERMMYVIREIRKHLKKSTNKKPPAPRKICMQLLSSISDVHHNESFNDIIEAMKELLSAYNYETIFSQILTEIHNGSYDCNKNYSGFEEKEKYNDTDIEGHQTICIYNDYHNLGEDKMGGVVPVQVVYDIKSSEDISNKEEDSTSSQSASWNAITPKLELDIDDSVSAENVSKYYVDNVHGTRTTVVANKNSEVMINIDDLNLKKEASSEMEEDETEVNFSDMNESYNVPYNDTCDEQLSDCDLEHCIQLKSNLVNLFKNEALLSKAECRKTLELLEHRKLRRRRLLNYLLSELHEII